MGVLFNSADSLSGIHALNCHKMLCLDWVLMQQNVIEYPSAMQFVSFPKTPMQTLPAHACL